MSRLVILVSDGVISRTADGNPAGPENWEPLPGSLEAIARLNHWGYRVAVLVTQQNATISSEQVDALNATHARFHQMLSRVGGHVDGIFGSADDPTEPRSGLYQAIAERFSQPLAGTPVIASTSQDLQAAQQLEALPMLISAQQKEPPLGEHNGNRVYPIFDDLGHAVEQLLSHHS